MSSTNLLRIAERIPDEAAAYEYLEQLRWNGTPECPHCGNTDRCYFLTPANGKTRQTRTGAATQRRLWKCGVCRQQFSVLTGTVMHGTKIPVRIWVFVLYEMCLSKNGVAAREIERKYGIAPRSAWFMTQRIREAMANGGVLHKMTGTIVADETFIGGKPKNRHASKRAAAPRKIPVLTLINKSTGESRSRVIPNVTGRTLKREMQKHIMPAAVLHTDSAPAYLDFARFVSEHHTVNHHEGEYVRDGKIGTNPAENFFSQLKRSIDGTHHHVSVEHLNRYLAEFDFRYSTRDESDTQRMARLAGQVGGVRLTYKPLISARRVS